MLMTEITPRWYTHTEFRPVEPTVEMSTDYMHAKYIQSVYNIDSKVSTAKLLRKINKIKK